MNQIDKYINSLCKHMNEKSEAVDELKLEIKFHIIKIVEELIIEGKTENESIKIAIDRFGDINELESELLEASNIKKRKFKIILYLSIVFSFISTILLVHEVLNYNLIRIPLLLMFLPIYLIFKYKQLDKYRASGISINKFYESMKICFTLYIILLFSNSIFPLLTYPNLSYISLFEINLSPSKTILNMINNTGIPLIYLLFSWIKNVVYFIPLGFLYPIVFKKKLTIPKIFLLGLIVFLTISLLQILFHYIGISAKNILISFDYFILNIIGVLIGNLLFNKTKKNIYNKFKA